jgi:AcrR family transcriptional regulator
MAEPENGPDQEAGLEPRAEETQERILEAAARVFAEKGYARATTREMAAAADVNEVTLFRHFGNKQNLFHAVIRAYGGPAVKADLEARLTGEYAEDLQIMGSALLEVLLERGDALRLMLCESAFFPEVREVMVQNPRQIFQMLAQYFERQSERGWIKALPPQAMAQVFAGTLFSYSVAQWIFVEALEPGLSVEDLVATLVEVFVNGTVERED